MFHFSQEDTCKHEQYIVLSLQVEFVVADITTADYQPESFDVIYSRDTILHIEDKETLFKNFLVS